MRGNPGGPGGWGPSLPRRALAHKRRDRTPHARTTRRSTDGSAMGDGWSYSDEFPGPWRFMQLDVGPRRP